MQDLELESFLMKGAVPAIPSNRRIAGTATFTAPFTFKVELVSALEFGLGDEVFAFPAVRSCEAYVEIYCKAMMIVFLMLIGKLYLPSRT